MPKLDHKKAVNPRNEAMSAIVNNRLNDAGTESGKSLRQEMEEQGVEMVDENTELAPETKDSDSHVDQNKEINIDIKDEILVPEEEPAEVIAVAEEEETPADPPEETPADPPEETPEENEEETHNLPVYEKEGKYYTKIKVDGQEEEVEFDRVLASHQKDEASLRRFQENARVAQDLEEREQRITAAEAKQVSTQNTPPEPVAKVDIGDTVNELYDSLAYEDEDTVKAKLAEIVSRGAHPQSVEEGRDNISTQNGEPEDIPAQVRAAMESEKMREWEAGRKAAVDQWEIDYADISQDAELRNFANAESARIAQEFPQQDISKTLAQAGDKARQWRDFQAGKPVEVTPAKAIDTDSRIDKKRSAAAPVRTNSAAAARTVEDNKPPSRSDIVKQIREGRGQAAV